MERSGMEQWHMELRPQTAATRQNWSERPRWQTAAISEEEVDKHELHPKIETRKACTSGKRRNTQDNLI
jgi:hypothetical protein